MVEGDTKGKWLYYFMAGQKGNATCCHYKCEIKIPMFNCIICKIYFFNNVIISATPCLPFFVGEFLKGR